LTARHSYQEAKAKTSIVEKTDGVFDDNGESGRSMDGWMEAAHISRLGSLEKKIPLSALIWSHPPPSTPTARGGGGGRKTLKSQVTRIPFNFVCREELL
jgi:hypothetical protein